MIDTHGDFEIVPDSLELEIAYWETFRSEWPMQQYMNGALLSDISRAHGRSKASLEAFFARRYGAKWRKRSIHATVYKPERVKITGPQSRALNKQIVSLLCEGWKVKEIATVLGVTLSMVKGRINNNNLREVAANDNYKPAYAAA